ncbi:MAG: hypothetical protein ACE5E6_07010 [Phycisphaerae bacterium]
MGLFWDLIQQSQIADQRHHAESLDARVVRLERELRDTRRLVNELVVRLETHFGEDINRDGRIG